MSSKKGSTGLSAEYRRVMSMLEAGNVEDAYRLVKTIKPSPIHTYDNLVLFAVVASCLWERRKCSELCSLWEESYVAVTSALDTYPELLNFFSKYYFCPCASAHSIDSEPRKRIMRCVWERNNVKDIKSGCLLVSNVSKYFPHLGFDVMEHLVPLIETITLSNKKTLTSEDVVCFVRAMSHTATRACDAGVPIPDYMYTVFLLVSFTSKILVFECATLYFEMCRGMRSFHHMTIISSLFDENERSSSENYLYMTRVIEEAISDPRSLKKCDKRFKTKFRICTGCSMVRDGFLHCSGCRLAYYCTRECCELDWPKHRMQCKLVAKVRKEQANQAK